MVRLHARLNGKSAASIQLSDITEALEIDEEEGMRLLAVVRGQSNFGDHAQRVEKNNRRWLIAGGVLLAVFVGISLVFGYVVVSFWQGVESEVQKGSDAPPHSTTDQKVPPAVKKTNP